MKRNLVIAGIDPGTTLGYALLDIKGNIIEINSSKEMDINSLISVVTGYGRVLIAGTDKSKVPGLIEQFSSKTGCEVVSPESDMMVKDKTDFANGYNVCNSHERDALSSAFFAFKKYRNLFEKIHSFAKKNNYLEIENDIIYLVIKHKLSIKNAVEMILEPDKKVSKETLKVVFDSNSESGFSKDDFFVLYSKFKRNEREILFLRKENANLKKRLKDADLRYSFIVKKALSNDSDKAYKKLIDNKEKRILSFDSKLKSRNKDIKNLKRKISNLNRFISQCSTNYVLKRLKNLGTKEFERKRNILGIKRGDILLVEDANIFSRNVISFLENYVKVIFYVKKPGNSILRLPFVFIDSREVSLRKTGDYAVASKREIDKILRSREVLYGIIDNYQNRFES